MDISQVIRERLEELGLEQQDLAASATVTESYISQLLTRKKMPPAPDRTDIYEKMSKFLKLPAGKLSELASLQRKEELKKTLVTPPAPLLGDVRELILRKCVRDKEKEVHAIFEKQPFGELERLVTQKLLDVVKGVAKEELENEKWLNLVAQLVGQRYEQMRVTVLEFLDTDIFSLSIENCDTFLDPLIESWDIDLVTFAMEIALNRRLVSGGPKKLEFVERKGERSEEEPGFKRFLRDSFLSGDATKDEIAFLKELRFNEKRPTALYYYRELQNLRDPLNFLASRIQTLRTKKPVADRAQQPAAPMHKHLDASVIGKQLPNHDRKMAAERWAKSRGKQSKKHKQKSQVTRSP